MSDLIYLDYQIVDDLQKGLKPELEMRIKALKEKGVLFPYSPAHIEEIAVALKRYGKENHEPRLKYLTQLSDDTSLLPYSRANVHAIKWHGIYVCNEDPKECFSRVISLYATNDIAEKIEEDVLANAAKSHIRLDPKIANNKKVYEVFNFRMMESLHLSFQRTAKAQGIETPAFVQDLNYFEAVSPNFVAWEMLVNFAFNVVESSGYYAEPLGNHRSRMHDVSHAIYGSYCSKLISADAKFLKKCAAVFHYLQVPCEVISAKEFQGLAS